VKSLFRMLQIIFNAGDEEGEKAIGKVANICKRLETDDNATVLRAIARISSTA